MKPLKEVTEFNKVIELISEQAVSEPGRLLCLKAEIFDEPEKIKSELLLTTQARKLIDYNFRLPLENFRDMTNVIFDAAKHIRLCAEEILEITDILRNARVVKNFLERTSEEFPELSANRESLFVSKEFEDKVSKTFNSDGTIKEDATGILRNLNRSLNDTKSVIKSEISKLLSNGDFTSDLRDTVYTQRNGRTVFQVKAECKNKISGIVHDISASGQTFFVEPKELTELHNKEREIEIGIRAEIERILKLFSEETGLHHKELTETIEILARIDFIFAKGRYSAKIDAVPAEITDTPKIVLKSMKNPVLMTVCEKITENDFISGEDNSIIIITGSNTGGKTVILKTVGLSILMTKAGIHIPCISAAVYPFKKIFADIGDEQSIEQSLSTFSSHIKNLITITENADKESLVLIDEICSGTDPVEGAAIARAVLKYLKAANAFCTVTTHYGELKTLALSEEGFENAGVRFDLETLMPTYQFSQGISGSSNALAVAKTLGLNETIVKDAETEGRSDCLTEKFTELEMLCSQAAKNFEEAKAAAKEAEHLKAEYEAKAEEIKKEKRKIIIEYKKKSQAEFEAAKSEIGVILGKLKENETRENAINAIRKSSLINKKHKSELSEEYEEYREEYRALDRSIVKAGDKVILRDLNNAGEFVSFTDKDRKAIILLGSVKTVVPVDKLAMYDKKFIKKSVELPTENKAKINFRHPDISYVLDLRGYRYEEALSETESYLDKACSAGLPNVRIIHGHGTGVLKKAIREYLSESPYVAKHRPGNDAEGGDGVSIIDLN